MNILIFTNHYPIKDLEIRTTKAVHYFAREWVKMGHNVIVVHNHIQLWNPYKKIFKQATNEQVLMKDKQTYEIDGVKVLFLPTYRFIPKTDYILKKDVNTAKEKILTYLAEEAFLPDRFIIHFCSEQWQIVEAIKDHFRCRPIPVFHNYDLKSPEKVMKVASECEKVGVRSKKIEEKLKSICGQSVRTFRVLSGAPDYIYNLSSVNQMLENKKRKELLYVGNLIPLKKIEVTIKALAKLKNNYDFIFRIIGSGESEHSLKTLVNDLDMDDRIVFYERMPREEIINYMSKSDCFIMVSQPETFGIVYVEAMACGCFVIGSKGEGIDGVIRDKFNGLLIEPDNVEELVTGIKYYFDLDSPDLNNIISNSIKTAEELKESKVAIKYLSEIK